MKRKTTCPVAPLARRADKLKTAIFETDEAGDHATARALSKELTAQYEYASYLQAKSAAGKDFHLSIVSTYSDTMCNSELSHRDRFSMNMTIRRIVESLQAQLAA